MEVCFTATFVSRLKQLKFSFCVAKYHWTYVFHSVRVDKNTVEILRFKRERVLFCFSDLPGGSVKKVYQIFSNLVYFCRFSFQFNLEKHKGDVGLVALGFY